MKCGITPELVTVLEPNQVFVYASNMLGVNGKGSALQAAKFGAKKGVGWGWSSTNTYAIPTKQNWWDKRGLPLVEIQDYVAKLHTRTRKRPEMHFLITRIGCGYAGYTDVDIAPMFRPFLELENCSLPQSFIDILTK